MTATNGFTHYENECNDAWVYQLSCMYNNISYEVLKETDKQLTTPIFSIMHAKSKWGEWNPSTGVMSFSSDLLKHYEWDAVKHVMKHEVAHQIVSEIFDMDCHQVSHGKLWAEACKIVGIEPKRCDSATFLSSFKGVEESSAVRKVKKLMNLANGRGATEAEMENALSKAQEVMIRHNIKLSDVTIDKHVWVKRPIGDRYTRWASWMWTVGQLLCDHYNVECIRTHNGYKVNDKGIRKSTHQLEIFGEPHNVDIAEYVAHALLNQAEMAYEKYRKEMAQIATQRREEMKKEGYFYKAESRISKRAFMEGLVNGYSYKLNSERSIVLDKIKAEDCSIVLGDDKLLKEMYGKAYPNRVNAHRSCAQGMGYGSGRKAGESLSLSQGLHTNGNRGKMLT